MLLTVIIILSNRCVGLVPLHWSFLPWNQYPSNPTPLSKLLVIAILLTTSVRSRYLHSTYRQHHVIFAFLHLDYFISFAFILVVTSGRLLCFYDWIAFHYVYMLCYHINCSDDLYFGWFHILDSVNIAPVSVGMKISL